MNCSIKETLDRIVGHPARRSSRMNVVESASERQNQRHSKNFSQNITSNDRDNIIQSRNGSTDMHLQIPTAHQRNLSLNIINIENNGYQRKFSGNSASNELNVINMSSIKEKRAR